MAAVFAQAQSAAPAVQNDSLLLTAAGAVQVAKAGTSNWNDGQTNQVLKIGDRLRTGRKSRATVRLSNLSILRVYELTTLEIQPPQQAGHNPVLDLKAGAAYFFNRDKPLETQFRTPSASGAIRGTEFNLAVNDDGRTEITLLDGQIDLSNEQGAVQLNTGEQGIVEKGKAPQKTAVIDAINIIQWTLFYPAILDLDELDLSADAKQILADSLAAYRSGDLLQALAKYPADRAPASESEKIYHAALLLSVGQVSAAENELKKSFSESNHAALASALQEMIAAVKHQSIEREKNSPRTLATEWLAGSYYEQSRINLGKALEMARSAVAKNPNFSFALERVAELEFSFGHTDAALKSLEKSLALSPRNAQALALKGFLLSAQNKISAARISFDNAIAIDGSLGNAWLGRGLVRIKINDVDGGRKDLQVAAALEPNRAIMRSYLGKAWSLNQPFGYSWNEKLATKEINLAKRLDPNDPTSWLYSALLNDQRNRINEALTDLEHSQELNNHRAVFRSQLLLDQDRAVRSANLASIYRDAGLTDVSVREAGKAVESDYANYSAHLFLAESYDALRDPKKRNLRFETPWENELLLANLLAPVGAGALSQNISQQEYSKLFEADRLGVSSRTEYFSTGDWVEEASQFGTLGNFAYSLDAYYRSEHGFRPNNDIEDQSFSAKFKQQITPKDTLFVQIDRNETSGGDVNQFFRQSSADPLLRFKEIQDPNLFVGYHHEWSPASHTLFLFRRLQDEFSLSDQGNVKFIEHGKTTTLRSLPVAFTLQSETEAYTTELQQIYQTDSQSLVVGGRYQFADAQTTDTMTSLDFSFSGNQRHSASSDLWRGSLYSYYQLKPVDSLRLTAGVTYDRLHFPDNIDLPPINNLEKDKEKISPKFGIDWTPLENTRLRGAYTRSLGGAFNDASTRIEPSEVAGFNQAFRSVIPESVAGNVPGTEFETWNVAVDQKFPTRTYVDVEGEFLNSRGDRSEGAFTNKFILALPDSPSSTSRNFDFHEKTLALNINQLVGKEWSLGARYRLSQADLTGSFAGIPLGIATKAGINQDETSTLHQLNLYANYNLPCGFFSQLQSIWSMQSNKGFTPNEPGDDFWHFNIFAGYRFPQRHAEIRLGVLNLTDQDYQLDPLNFYLEMPRRRTFAASFKFNF